MGTKAKHKSQNLTQWEVHPILSFKYIYFFVDEIIVQI